MKTLLTLLLSTFFIFPNHPNLNMEIESLNLESENYILYSIDSDSVIASKNANSPLAAASINKVLTAITVIDLLEDEDLNQEITVDPIIFEHLDPVASTAGLRSFQVLTLKEVLYAIILPSGADATSLASYYLTGSHDGLVDEMNKKAKEIGMMHTHITNTSGLDNPNQYTTLEDLLILIRYALENETFKEIYTKSEYTLIHKDDFVLENEVLKEANKRDFSYLYGAKSGYTKMSQRALSSIAKRDDTEYIFISTGAEAIYYGDNLALMDAIETYSFLFDNFHKEVLFKKDEVMDSIKIKRRLRPFDLTYTEDISAILPHDFDNTQLKTEFEYDKNVLKAPINKGTILGSKTIYYKDVLVSQEDITASKDINISFAYIILLLIKILLAFYALLYIFKRFKRTIRNISEY